MTTIEFVVSLLGGAGGGAGTKAAFDYLRTRATVAGAARKAAADAELTASRNEVGADLTLNERLWARVAQLESRLDAERDDCDSKLEVMRRQVEVLTATCTRQEGEILALQRDKGAVADQAQRLIAEMAELRRHGGSR